MRKTAIYISAAVTALSVLCACSNSEPEQGEVPASAGERVEAKVTGRLAGQTRVSGNTFEDNDKIGVSCVSNEDGAPMRPDDPMRYWSNVPYEYIDLGSTMDFYAVDGGGIWYLNSDVKEFSAYWPYADLNTPGQLPEFGSALEVTSDRRLKINMLQAQNGVADVLYATGAKGSKDDPTIVFSGDAAFCHLMAKLVIRIYPQKVAGSEDLSKFSDSEAQEFLSMNKDSGYDVCIGDVHATGLFDPIGGVLEIDRNASKGRVALVSGGAKHAATDTYVEIEAYVLPETVDLAFTIFGRYKDKSAGNLERPCYVTEPVSVRFESSKEYRYDILLSPHYTIVKNCVIKPWDAGSSHIMGGEFH